MACKDPSAKCRKARQEYDEAEFDRSRCEARLNELKDIRAGGTSAVGVGGVILAGVVVVTGPIGWIGAVGLTLFAAGLGSAAFAQREIDQVRSQCEDARRRMFEAYQRAGKKCSQAGCLPPRSWTTPCP